MTEIDLDSFAGGGGASTGLRDALDKPVDIAINHSDAAIAMHRANHPETKHYCESIWTVNPREACRGKRVRVAWFSPDCTHFSRAKGGKPRSKEVRGLANVVIDWAREVRPRVIILENVQEFQDWGPLDEKGRPIAARKGEDFRAWLAELFRYYKSIDYRVLRADRYGTPTSRARFYLVARLDGQQVVWPEPTHGEGTPRPVRTAAEIIDWNLPCPSIFERKKPLAEATQRRIAAGLKRYVIDCPQPFIVGVSHGTFPTRPGSRVRGRDMREPVPTITTGDHHYLAMPFIKSDYGASIGRGVNCPLPTVTAGGGGHHSLVAPTLVTMGYGERPGQSPRVPGLDKPLGTVVAGGRHHALVAAFLAKHYTMPSGKPLAGIPCDSPLHTVTACDHHSLVTAHIEKFYGTASGASCDEPLPTVTATGQHLAEVRAFLVKYYSSDGSVESQHQAADEALHTITTKARFGLVMVHGQPYQIVDIGLRMLSPRELFSAQGFPSDYVIDVEFEGRQMTKTLQIELAGNTVCPQMARELAKANVYERRAAA